MCGKQGFKERHAGWLRGSASLRVVRAERDALAAELRIRIEVEKQHAELLARLIRQGEL